MAGKKQPERENPQCKVCECALNDESWTPSCRKARRYICRACWVARQKAYQIKDPNWREKRQLRSKAYRENLDPEVKRKRARDTRCRYIRKTFGISLDQYEEMVLERNGCCDICKSGTKGMGTLHIDHCHKTGMVRGLLCMNCNVSLGLMYDDPEIMENAIKYIQNSKETISE